MYLSVKFISSKLCTKVLVEMDHYRPMQVTKLFFMSAQQGHMEEEMGSVPNAEM